MAPTTKLIAVLNGLILSEDKLQLLLSNKKKKIRRLVILHELKRRNRVAVIKTGLACNLFLQMDDYTLRRHIRFNREQLQTFVGFLIEWGHDDPPARPGGPAQISIERKALIFLWYMSNANSFREMSDKFNVSQGAAHNIIMRVLKDIHKLSQRYITWPDHHERTQNTRQFYRICGKQNILGAIDGCHISILKPAKSGISYMNRKGYFSVLMQGVCDWKGQFTDVFIGPPGRVHDARMLRRSTLYASVDNRLGNRWKLLGDSAYISNDFHFILTPKRDNGNLKKIKFLR